ncbi:NAD(P)-binding protein [Serendipita vermifera]|nr:NAD(P)-binding protein [Serendipita vermifera]
MPTIFVLGATGYIGGSVLVGYKRAFPDYGFVALVRNEKNFAAVEALGVKVVKGSHSDVDIVEEQASKADIVLNAADADDLELTKAVLRGIKRSSAGKTPILVHTSGTALVTKESDGKFRAQDKVWNDNDVEDIRSIPEDAPHRKIDLAIFEADTEGYVSAYIIAPSTIYDTGNGPVNRLSQQVPVMIKEALAQKQAAYVGDGTNEWNHVHIEDLVDLYVLVLKLATSELEPAAATDCYTRFFWGSVGTHKWGDIAREIGKILHAKGTVGTPEAKSIPPRPELAAVSTNSRTVAERSLKNGWQPKGRSLVESLPDTVDQVLALNPLGKYQSIG